MKIAAAVPAHADTHVVNDTLASIRLNMTENILVVADGWAYEKIKDQVDGDVLSGLCQGGAQGSHANRMFGLSNLYAKYPDCDWYCWIEYDALVANDHFKQDLHEASPDEWMAGFCVCRSRFDAPVFPVIFRYPGLQELTYALGAVVFHRREFLAQLQADGMFEWVVNSTAAFSSCHIQGLVNQFPGLTLNKEMYDLGEHLMGTLADRYGKKAKSLSHWEQQHWLLQKHGSSTTPYWSGNYQRYPVRWTPMLREEENILGTTSILHPLKEYDDPIRVFYRERRRT